MLGLGRERPLRDDTPAMAERRNLGAEMELLIDGLGFEVVSVTPASARRIAEAYARWGKAFTRPRSIPGIASPMRWPRSMAADCFASARISRGRMSRAPLEGWPPRN
jgi:hypothetical protein